MAGAVWDAAMDPVLVDYFDALWKARAEARRPLFSEVQYRDQSTPQSARCHANVDRWVAENPEARTVRGWLVVAQSGDDQAWFERHSIVEADGRWIEITLKHPLPFLAHHGDAALWTEVSRINQLAWPPRCDASIASGTIDPWDVPVPPAGPLDV